MDALEWYILIHSNGQIDDEKFIRLIKEERTRLESKIDQINGLVDRVEELNSREFSNKELNLD